MFTTIGAILDQILEGLLGKKRSADEDEDEDDDEVR